MERLVKESLGLCAKSYRGNKKRRGLCEKPLLFYDIGKHI